MSELSALKDRISEASEQLKRSGVHVTSVGPDIKEEKVIVRVLELTEDKAQLIYERFGPEHLSIIEGGYATTNR